MAINQGDLVQATQLQSWYNRLNALRTKTGLTAITVPNEQNKLVTARNIEILNNELNNFKNEKSSWYSKTKEYMVNKGSLIETSINSELLTLFDTWDNVCYGYSSCDCCVGYDSADNNGHCPNHVCPYSGNHSVCPENVVVSDTSQNSTDKVQVVRDSDMTDDTRVEL